MALSAKEWLYDLGILIYVRGKITLISQFNNASILLKASVCFESKWPFGYIFCTFG